MKKRENKKSKVRREDLVDILGDTLAMMSNIIEGYKKTKKKRSGGLLEDKELLKIKKDVEPLLLDDRLTSEQRTNYRKIYEGILSEAERLQRIYTLPGSSQEKNSPYRHYSSAVPRTHPEDGYYDKLKTKIIW